MKQTALITGGTGFLGKRLGLALKDRYRVVLTGRNNKHNLDAQEFTGCPTLPMDVTNIESIRDIFTEVRPDVVVHAAATKYVDLSELQPMECLDINVLGSQNIARVCVEKGVSTVIGMSTDKTAPPVANTYGLTKALMERLFCAMNAKTKTTRFACVRHGISRKMKAAVIRDFLEVWIKHKGGRWEQIEGRPGERPHEYLIGEPELLYTREVEFDGLPHFIIKFNHPVEQPLPAPFCSANAPRLTEEEMLAIINDPPMEEL